MRTILLVKYFGKLLVFLLLLLVSPSVATDGKTGIKPHTADSYTNVIKDNGRTPTNAWLSTLIICGLLFANVAIIEVNKDTNSY